MYLCYLYTGFEAGSWTIIQGEPDLLQTQETWIYKPKLLGSRMTALSSPKVRPCSSLCVFYSNCDLLWIYWYGWNGKDNTRIEDELDRSRCVAGLNHMERKKKVYNTTVRNRMRARRQRTGRDWTLIQRCSNNTLIWHHLLQTSCYYCSWGRYLNMSPLLQKHKGECLLECNYQTRPQSNGN